MKLIINNFQSIEHCELDFPKNGFTCIVGKSNIGKSACRRALEAVLYNKGEASYIRHGCDRCSVHLIFEDATKIDWYRNKTTSWYVINGEEFKKLNKSVPDIILEKGFKELVINDKKFNIQIASQFAPVFLLNESGSFITEVLSNLGNLNRVITANRNCLADQRQVKEKLNVRRQDLEKSETELEKFKRLPLQKEAVHKIQEILKKLQDSELLFKTLSALRQTYEKAGRKLINMRAVYKVSVEFKGTSSYEAFIKLSELAKAYFRHQKILNFYKEIPKPTDYKDLLKESTLFQKLSGLTKEYDRCLRVSIVNKQLLLTNLRDPIFAHDNYKNIKTLYTALQEYKKNILDFRAQLQEAQEQLQGAEKEHTEVMSDLKICPLCERAL